MVDFANVHQSLSSEALECPWSFSMIRLLWGALVMSVKTNVDVPLKTWRMTVHNARSSMWKPAWRCRIESGVSSPKNCSRKHWCCYEVVHEFLICLDWDEGTHSFSWQWIDEVSPVSSSPQREADFFSTTDKLQSDDWITRIEMYSFIQQGCIQFTDSDRKDFYFN